MPDTAIEFDENQAPESASEATQDNVTPPADNPAPSTTEGQQEAPAQPRAEQTSSTQFNEEQQRIFNDAIGKKVAKLRAAEEARRAAEQEAEELRKRLTEIEAPQRPVVPDLPDPFDDAYETKMADREKAIQEAAQFDAIAHQNALRAQQEVERQQRKAMEQQQKAVVAYAERANKLGIKPDELQQAANVVGQYNVPIDVVNHILQDDRGAAITMYLGNNPLEIDALCQMTPAQAGAYIETKIKPSAMSARPTPNPPPSPIETPTGAGMPESGGGVAGVTYE